MPKRKMAKATLERPDADPAAQIRKLLGGGEASSQLTVLHGLFNAVRAPVHGLLVLGDTRPGHQPRILPFGDQVPLAAQRKLLMAATDSLMDAEARAAQDKPSTPPKTEEETP